MKQALSKPCDQCPFLDKMSNGFTMKRLTELALIYDFHCHKSGDSVEDSEGFSEFKANKNSVLCAGAMIFLAKRKDKYTYGFDDSKLDMTALVR